MARPNRIREIARQRGEKPEQMVLNALNEHQTLVRAADALGLSFQTLWDYSNKRFRKVCRWQEIPKIFDGEFTAVIEIDPITDTEGQAQ